jgi:hypothetical protein
VHECAECTWVLAVIHAWNWREYTVFCELDVHEYQSCVCMDPDTASEYIALEHTHTHTHTHTILLYIVVHCCTCALYIVPDALCIVHWLCIGTWLYMVAHRLYIDCTLLHNWLHIDVHCCPWLYMCTVHCAWCIVRCTLCIGTWLYTAAHGLYTAAHCCTSVAHCCTWPHAAAHCCTWLYMIAHCCTWLYMVHTCEQLHTCVHGFGAHMSHVLLVLELYMIVHDCTLLYMVVHGACLWAAVHVCAWLLSTHITCVVGFGASWTMPYPCLPFGCSGISSSSLCAGCSRHSSSNLYAGCSEISSSSLCAGCSGHGSGSLSASSSYSPVIQWLWFWFYVCVCIYVLYCTYCVCYMLYFVLYCCACDAQILYSFYTTSGACTWCMCCATLQCDICNVLCNVLCIVQHAMCWKMQLDMLCAGPTVSCRRHGAVLQADAAVLQSAWCSATSNLHGAVLQW